MAALVCFCACDKDNLGVYNPKLKIQQIYEESEGHYLKEKWLWNGDQLAKINFYRKNGDIQYSHVYSYDNKRLARIDADGEHSEFLYDKNKLSTINTYLGDKLTEIYTFSYEGNKLSNIHIEKPAKGAEATNFDFLNLVVPNYDPVVRTSMFNADSKGENYLFSSASIDFIWNGDNIMYMKMTINRPDSVQKITYTYMYDDNVNPQYHFMPLLLDHELLNDNPETLFASKNNATSIHVTYGAGAFSRTVSYTYAYDYYQKYPTKMYKTSINAISLEETRTLLYSYRYQ